MKSTLVIALGAFVLTASAAFAQTPAATPMAPAAPATTTSQKMAKPATKGAMAKPRTAASLECSKKADAMKVHGAKRKTFMSSCKKESSAK